MHGKRRAACARAAKRKPWQQKIMAQKSHKVNALWLLFAYN